MPDSAKNTRAARSSVARDRVAGIHADPPVATASEDIPFRAIVEQAPDAVIVVAPDGRITLVNRQTETLFGYTRAELLGQPVERLIPERFHRVHQGHRAAYSTTPRTRPMGSGLRLFGRRRDGGEFPVEVSLSPLEAASGDRAIIASVRDISELERVEAARAAAEAAREELRRLLALTDTALSHLALDDLLHDLLGRVREVMGVDNVAILLLDADGRTLQVRAAHGPEETVAAAVRVPVGQGFAGRIAATRAPLALDDLASADVVNPLLRERLRSALGVPLLLDGRLLGVMHVGSATPRRFTDVDVQQLQRVADRVAIAIDRANLFKAERQARHEAEAALVRARASEERFERLVEAGIIGIVVADSERIIEANAAYLRLLGYSHSDLATGRLRADTVTAPESKAAMSRAIQEARLRGACEPFEQEYLRQDGSRIPALVGIVLLEREPARFVSFILDLSERKWLEQQWGEARARELAAAEVARSLDQFFAAAAHDIRNPAAVVKGNVQVARRHFARLRSELAAEPTGDAAGVALALATLGEALESADASAEHLSRLVARLFDVARARAGTLEVHLAPCDLAALVHAGVEAQRAAAPGRTIRLELPNAGAATILADADRLSQVLANYVTNALKYSADDQPVEVRLEVSEGLAVVAVRDQGPGLPWEEQSQVWEPFHRAPGVEALSRAGGEGSLGLGLHICKRIVELHGGRVGVESAVGQGSTFWFTLPLTERKAEP